MFLSNSAIVGVGYDFNPLLFSQDANNFWSFSEFVDKKPAESAVKRNSGGFSAGKISPLFILESILALMCLVSNAYLNPSSKPVREQGDTWKHESNITCIQPYARSPSGGVTEFSTSGTIYLEPVEVTSAYGLTAKILWWGSFM
ncbi:hypothetical protein ON010_g18174 [Phytophthora cinnamomi]|nr:hypothetical protein ON010_g18174 [Phytophthora cinnamomi]